MSAEAPAIIDERKAWLEERRKIIGASDVAAILGVDPRRGALAVYAEKVGAIDQAETPWMKWGRRVEGAIAEGYSEETGRPAFDLGAHVIQRHRDLPWLGATLDRQTRGCVQTPDPFGGVELPLAGSRISPVFSALGPLEAKAVAGHKAKEWREDPPLFFQVQLQIQMACTAAQWGSLVALIGGLALVWKDLVRNDRFLAATYPKVEEFWLRVQRREPPEADALPGTTDAIKRLWSEDDGETITLDHEALELIESWEAAVITTKAAGETEQELENKLRVRMQGATFGALPDGTFVTLKTTKNPGYSRVVDPYQYRTLRHFRPRIRRRWL